MVSVIAALAILAVVTGWTRFMLNQRPLWMAFSATAAGVYCSVAGLAGYTLSKHDRFVAHTSWAGHVIWYQVGLGVLVGLVAMWFWRRALSGGGRA